MEKIDTTQEIISNVRQYFRANGLSFKKVSEILGVTLAAVTNQMGDRSFGKNNAQKYADAFGFDAHYLQTGRGSLIPKQPEEESNPTEQGGIYLPKETLQMYTSMADSIKQLSSLVDRLTTSIATPTKGGISYRDSLK